MKRLLPVVAFCVACTQDFPVSLVLDDDLEPAAVDAIAQATDDWRNATAGQALVWLSIGPADCDDIGDEDIPTLYACHITDEFVRERDEANVPRKVLGYGSLDHVVLVMDRLLTPEHIYSVTLHELGHFFGLHHEDGTLMGPGHDACIDDGTLRQWCSMYPCGGGEEPTCGPNASVMPEDACGQ